MLLQVGSEVRHIGARLQSLPLGEQMKNNKLGGGGEAGVGGAKSEKGQADKKKSDLSKT